MNDFKVLDELMITVLGTATTFSPMGIRGKRYCWHRALQQSLLEITKCYLHWYSGVTEHHMTQKSYANKIVRKCIGMHICNEPVMSIGSIDMWGYFWCVAEFPQLPAWAHEGHTAQWLVHAYSAMYYFLWSLYFILGIPEIPLQGVKGQLRRCCFLFTDLSRNLR